MENKDYLTEVVRIFTGKGGTVRLAVATIAVLGLGSMIIENNNVLKYQTKDGRTLTVQPAKKYDFEEGVDYDEASENENLILKEKEKLDE